MEERGESQQNNASRISCICSTTAKHAPRRASRSHASRKPATQRNLRPESGTGGIAGPSVGRRAPDFRSVVPSPENSIVVVFGEFWPKEPPVIKQVYCVRKIRVGWCLFEPQFVAFWNWFLREEKPKLWQLLIFGCPIFVDFLKIIIFAWWNYIWVSINSSSSSSSSFALRYPFFNVKWQGHGVTHPLLKFWSSKRKIQIAL